MVSVKLDLKVSLDHTLGCGQAHRWTKKGNLWEGVLGNKIITLEERDGQILCEGTDDKNMMLDYLRHRDDLDLIYSEISEDPFVRRLASACPGMRILKQDPWECIATYVLATNANVKRIGAMVGSVCRTFGKDLGGRFSFPSAEDIAQRGHLIGGCKLGYREKRFIELAENVADNVIIPNDLAHMDYKECFDSLNTINGIGNKVADCVSLFAFGHLNAFPIDARIERVLKEVYGVTGSYKRLSSFASERFGRFAGYAQELLYHGDIILGLSQAHAGGSQPI
jgi:N-glycosylase/DNA lyase